MTLFLALFLAQGGDSSLSDRVTRIEAKTESIERSVTRIERKLDRDSQQDPAHSGYEQYWPLLGVLWLLDKGGYYIKRKNGNGGETNNGHK